MQGGGGALTSSIVSKERSDLIIIHGKIQSINGPEGLLPEALLKNLLELADDNGLLAPHLCTCFLHISRWLHGRFKASMGS